MDDKNDPSYVAQSNTIDLDTVREALRLPTSLAAILGKLAGGQIEEMRPGLVRVAVTPDTGVSIRVSKINIYALEAKAYRNAGRPVPDYVIKDIALWEKQNRGR